MLSPYCALFLLSCLAVVLADETKEIPAVEPEYLDMLLESGQYEKFAELMGIEDVDLVRPAAGDGNKYPMFNKGLHQGDIVLAPHEAEQTRQGIRFEKYSGSKWKNNVVHYAISTSYSTSQRNIINAGIKEWKDDIGNCIEFVPHKSEKDYVFFFPGDGCYSSLGRRGGQQSISLQKNGCLYVATVIHEMGHAVGFAHEQNRWDRDDFIEILWNNIPEDWHSQYEKTDPNDFGLQDKYDYYSIMHYPVPAPETNKPAFRVKKSGIDEKKIGNGDSLTESDKRKIREQYCPNSG